MTPRKFLIPCLIAFALPVAHAASTVGTCRQSPHNYPTITAALAAAHPADVISVCPGTYAEQVVITRPVTLQGISVAHQPIATIVAPAAGLKDFPAGSGFYPQVYVNQVNGPVRITNLAINGASANVLVGSYAFDTSSACQIGFLYGFSGIYFNGSAGIVDHVSISGHFVSSLSPGDNGPQLYPNCGSGIEFNNTHQQGYVTDSSINGFGLVGITASGNFFADRNTLNGANSGPYQVGIWAPAAAIITNNTITGGQFQQTTGIQGGKIVQGNVLRNWTFGIVQANKVTDNTLINNATAIVKPGVAQENLVSAAARYPDPTCADGSCSANTKPSVGIDMQCSSASPDRLNGFFGVGIGFANMKAGQSAPLTNIYSNVATTSTSCTQ